MQKYILYRFIPTDFATRTTQELASWALGESPSSRSLASHRLSPSDADLQRAPSVFSDSEQGEPRDSIDSSRPEAIEEVSEPVSPEEHGQQAGDHTKAMPSTLSNLLRSSTSKPSDYLPPGPRGSFGSGGRSRSPQIVIGDADVDEVTETTSLLPRARLPEPPRNKWKDVGFHERSLHPIKGRWKSFRYELGRYWKSLRTPRDWDIRNASSIAIGAVAAVSLGLLLNVLDALSYGM